VTAKFERDLGFNKRARQWLERMSASGWSGRDLGDKLGDADGSHAWAAKLQRWAETKTDKRGVPVRGVAPRAEVADVFRRLELAEAPELLAWIYAEREQPPAWMLNERATPFAVSQVASMAIAQPGAHLASAEVARAAVGSSAPVAVVRRSSLPSSVRALLVDVRDGAVSLEEAERVLSAIFLGSNSTTSAGRSGAGRSSGLGRVLPLRDEHP
jgi:hypothetical protein